ncbi:MAG: TlpA disulfide reductase family protein [Dehalococcoidia bacterium]|nr:TlpA family protein disulfide reductase [Dehalococcoidia bacterium]MCB9485815.1 TlpA family protein disulfide reductase [Thermoflexaceae bacterium]
MVDPVQGRKQGRTGQVALGLAAVVAIAVATFLFLRAGGDDSTTPAASDPFAPTGTAAAARPDLGPLVAARPTVGELAPDFALLDARDGSVRKLSDFRGTPVLINWYASWCGPCRAEIPEFNAVLNSPGGAGMVVLGVDYQESASRAVSILDELSASFPAVLDTDGKVADHYRVGNRLPSTFLVDKDGILRAMKIGQITPDELPDLLATIGVQYTPTN